MTVAPFPPDDGDTVENALLGGRVRLRQPARGYRAGMDAALLAAAVAVEPGQRVIEAGCGAGAVLMQIAARRPGTALTGLERDPAMAALARDNAALNGADARIVEGDVAAGFRALEIEPFDWAVSNPPFFEPGTVRAPAEGKQAAYLAETPLKAWILFLHHITRPGGRITLIHRAGVLGDLLELLGPRTGEIEVLPVRPAAGEAAGRVLIRARKGLRRGPVTLYDGLALHDAPSGPATVRAAEALRGGALEWR